MMPIWARICGGLVAEKTDIDPSGRFDPSMVWTGDISAVVPQPQIGWTATKGGESWIFAAPAPAPTPTLAERASALLSVGLTITSAATPALNAAYACDPTTQNHIQAEIVSLLVNGTFADGGAVVAWPDTSGTTHSFTIPQFKAFATALAAFVAGCAKVINGTSTTLPSATATMP